MSKVYALAQIAALTGVSANVESGLESDRRAVAAAVEFWEYRPLTSLTVHKAADVFFDDAGLNLFDYLRYHSSKIRPKVSNCKVTDIEVVPTDQRTLAFVPKDLLILGGVRELRMVIRCVGKPRLKATIWYRADMLARLQFAGPESE